MLDFYIPHREEGEKIILLLRRHRYILMVKIAFWGIVALMPIVLYAIIKGTFINIIQTEFFAPIAVLFLSVYYLYIWLFAFHSFVDYYLDMWIVTNRRIINIEQKGLFARTVSEQKLSRVQDVTSDIKGMFATLFDFGTVHIQTAGEEARFIFKQIPDPYHVARKIAKLSEQSRKFERVMDQKDEIHTNLK